MAQRPSGLSRVARTRKSAPIPPEPHPGHGNGLSWTGRNGWIGHAAAHENRPGTETPTPTPAPTDGEGLPDGPMCRMCRAYPVDPEWHEQWHANLDSWARGVNADLADMQRFLQERGYVPKGGDSAASDGEAGE